METQPTETLVAPTPPAQIGVIKVSGQSRPASVAGAIAAVVRERRRAEVHAVGAPAVNQATKAIALAREYLAEDSIDAICIPGFVKVMIGGEARTALLLVVEPR